jgi:hypothetical protein
MPSISASLSRTGTTITRDLHLMCECPPNDVKRSLQPPRRGGGKWRLVAGKRPLAGLDQSDFGLLRHFERVIHLNS